MLQIPSVLIVMTLAILLMSQLVASPNQSHGPLFRWLLISLLIMGAVVLREHDFECIVHEYALAAENVIDNEFWCNLW